MLRKLIFWMSLCQFLGCPALAADLNIQPVVQETLELCWAASAQMVFQHFGFPNLNPAGDYQCGIIGARGGLCTMDCRVCPGAGGTTQQIATTMRAYATVARAYGFDASNFQVRTSGVLSPSEIIAAIDADAPIIAGITPQGIVFPAGSGISQHAVVIVGYDGDADDLEVIINDPYPYGLGLAPVPYLKEDVGGTMLEPGQYQLPYRSLVQKVNYRNSITFN